MRIFLRFLPIISMLSISSVGLSDTSRTSGANCSLTNAATGKVYYSIMYAGSYVRSKQVATQNVMSQCQSEAEGNVAGSCLVTNVSCSVAFRI